MAGFESDWLDLREPADRAARSQRLLRLAAEDLRRGPGGSVCDLGAGTGAAMRAFAPLFPPGLHWTLIDNDEALLARATAYPGASLTARAADLEAMPAAWPGDCALVTATAFFDLASPAWIARLVAALASDEIPLLACLTYDGTIELDPPHPADDAVKDAFNLHQGGNKGLGGPAAGPAAHDHLVACFESEGYEVHVEASPWGLSAASSGPLIAATLAGIATAAVESGEVAREDGAAWLEDRRERLVRLTIGHRDLYARPRQMPARSDPA